MILDYAKLLPQAFKWMSIKSAGRTMLPTLGYYLTRPELPLSNRPAIFTMNILPPLLTLWYHFAKKNLGGNADIVIFDCSGGLHPQEFPDAKVYRFLNFYAATKSDEFLRSIAHLRRIGWICDDDMFLMSPAALAIVEREMEIPGTASVSFRPRGWWDFLIEGKTYEVSSSYCTAINRHIFVEKEHLSLAPADGNTHPSRIGKPPGRYDTFDKANEILLKKGYRCFIVPKEERERAVTGFTGISGAVALLHYFKTPEQTLEYYRTPPKEQWRGNILFGTLSAMLAICDIVDLAERIRGKRHHLRSLPTRSALEKIREDHKHLLRPDQSVTWFDDVAARLRREL